MMVKRRLQYFGGNKLVEPRERSADSRRIRSEDIGSVLRITEVEKPYVGLEGLSDEELDDWHEANNARRLDQSDRNHWNPTILRFKLQDPPAQHSGTVTVHTEKDRVIKGEPGQMMVGGQGCFPEADCWSTSKEKWFPRGEPWSKKSRHWWRWTWARRRRGCWGRAG